MNSYGMSSGPAALSFLQRFIAYSRSGRVKGWLMSVFGLGGVSFEKKCFFHSQIGVYV
jgi:hypothetical protein